MTYDLRRMTYVLRFPRWIAPLALIFSAGTAAADAFAEKVVPLLDQHCYRCHGEKRQKGGIELHQVKNTEDAYRHHRFLKNVAQQIKTGEMPP